MAEAPKKPEGTALPTPALPTLPLSTRAAYSQITPIARQCTEDLAAELRNRPPAVLQATPDSISGRIRDAAAYLMTPGRFTPGPLAPDAERQGYYNAERLKQRALDTGKLVGTGAALLTGELMPLTLTARTMFSVRAGSSVNTSLNPDVQHIVGDTYRAARNAVSDPLNPSSSRIGNIISTAVAAVVGTPASAKPITRPTMTPKP